MPLMKFRLKKSRQYNVSTKSLYVLSVTLLDNNDIECTLNSDSTGKDCLDNICQRLSLQQPEFFGLRYQSRHSVSAQSRHPHLATMRWLELEKPVKKQLEKHGREHKMYLGVMYYITDIHLLQCENTRYQYFLQLKQDVLKGKLTCNFEQAIMLAAYSLQASFGDHDPERHNLEYFREMESHLPEYIMAKEPSQLLQILEQVILRYIGLQSLSPTLAEVYYIVEAQRLEGYGVEFFPAKESHEQEVLVGSSLLGIVIRHFHPRPTLHYYRWSDISNLVNQKRSFTIERQTSSSIGGSGVESLTFTFEGHDLAKYVWKLCVIQHTFFKRQQVLLGIPDGLEEDQAALPAPDISSSATVPSDQTDSGCGGLPDIHPLSQNLNAAAALHLAGNVGGLTAQGIGGSSYAVSAPGMNTYSATPHSLPGILHQSGGPSIPGPMTQNLAAYEDPHFQTSNAGAVAGDIMYHHRGIIPEHHMSSPNLRSSAGGPSSLEHTHNGGSGLPPHLLPQYRQAPDYETAVAFKYGSRSGLPIQQPGSGDNDLSVGNHRGSNYSSQPNLAPALGRTHGMLIKEQQYGGAHVTPPLAPGGNRSDLYLSPLNYSSPDLNHDHAPAQGVVEGRHPLYPRRPPPSYETAVSKLHSTSFPDLPSYGISAGQVTGSSPDLVPLASNPPPSVYQVGKPTGPPGVQQDVASARPDASVSVASSVSKQTPNASTGKSQTSSEPIYENIPPRHAPPPYVKAVLQNRGLLVSSVSSHQEQVEEEPEGMSVSEGSSRIGSGGRNFLSTPTSLSSSVASMTAGLRHLAIGSSSGASSSSKKSTGSAAATPTTGGKSSVQASAGPSRGSQYSFVSPIKDTRVADLVERISGMTLVTEFESIPREKPGCVTSAAAHPENTSKNRFRDVLPYDENRVSLTPTKDNRLGYINASHITMTVANVTRFYVAAQGPLPSTVAHFWQAVWEQDVHVVVMLNTVTAGNPGQQYWPAKDGETLTFADFTVHRQCSSPGSSYVTSRLQLSYRKKSRALWHLQYTDWADHGCPEDVQGFVSFLEEMDLLRRQSLSELSLSSSRNPPVLVHCSAGVGRTGVTILCDILLYCLDHNLPLDVPRNLAVLREQRANLVQTVLQYRFVYEVLIQYLQQSRLI